MVLGGVAFYWSLLDKGKSVAQNIDDLLFARTDQLHNEFNELYDSLFSNPIPYIKIINILGTVRVGMPRTELLDNLRMTSGAQVTRLLEDLEECGFIRRYNAFGKKRNDAIYQLTDNFTFYFKFMKDNKNEDEHFWSINHSPTLQQMHPKKLGNIHLNFILLFTRLILLCHFSDF